MVSLRRGLRGGVRLGGPAARSLVGGFWLRVPHNFSRLCAENKRPPSISVLLVHRCWLLSGFARRGIHARAFQCAAPFHLFLCSHWFSAFVLVSACGSCKFGSHRGDGHGYVCAGGLVLLKTSNCDRAFVHGCCWRFCQH